MRSIKAFHRSHLGKLNGLIIMYNACANDALRVTGVIYKK